MISINPHSLEAPPHEIPIWALRLEVQGIINRYAEVFECSRDFITAAVYAIVSTICGKHIELFDGKYNNNPNHWICVVAPSGSNKSAPIKALLEPIFKEEKLRIKKFKEEYREYKKNGGEEPVRDRLIVSDVTPEGLYQVLADKDNTKAGLLLYRDEIKGFLDDMNRYNSSGEISNYLSIYDGTPFPVDRKTQEPQWISNPFLCILGGIQPRAIANAFKPSWADEGFVQRWLYVYPQVLPEKEYKDNVLDEMYKTAWYEMTDKLNAIGDMKLLLSTEAKVLLTEFNKETAKKEKDADPWVASILSKIRIQIEKWCAITHILSCGESAGAGQYFALPTSMIISEEEMRYSIECMRYFEYCGYRMLKQMKGYSSNEMTKAQLIAELVKRTERQKLNIQKLADAIGVSRQYVSKIVNQASELRGCTCDTFQLTDNEDVNSWRNRNL